MESNKVKISWVIATRNRLSLLKLCIERLLDNFQEGEEILVVDGASTDGSAEYLQNLYESGKIHGFCSQKDRNQSHGWNKVILMAKGKYIKKLIDDDIVNFDIIRECIAEMEKHPGADICISDEMSMNIDYAGSLARHTRLPQFLLWKAGKVPSFTFGDIHMIIRRESLALIGLYNPSFTMMDYEYSLRISYLKAGILYYTGCSALSVSSSETVSSQVTRALLDKEGIRANAMYEYIGDSAQISGWSKIKIQAGKWRDKLSGRKKLNNQNRRKISQTNISELSLIYSEAWKSLENENQKNPGKFIYSGQ